MVKQLKQLIGFLRSDKGIALLFAAWMIFGFYMLSLDVLELVGFIEMERDEGCSVRYYSSFRGPEAGIDC